MENLRAQDNGLADQISHAHLPLSVGLAVVVQSVSVHNSSVEALNRVINMVHCEPNFMPTLF